jgi:hypothetical protein
MKKRRIVGLIGLLAAALLAISCSLPQGPAGSSPEFPLEETTLLTVETDDARGQGIYVNEWGRRQDIESFEDSEERTVRCTQAIAIVPFDSTPMAASHGQAGPDVKAVIIGMRDDGKPGVWAVYNDDTIHPLFLKEGERSCSLLPESEARQGGMRGLFGWRYTPIAARSDGSGDLLIVGEAVNEEGFQLGPWSVEPESRVGIYWKLIRHHRRGFYHASSARVIGTPPEGPGKGHGNRGRYRHGYAYGFYGHFLSSLRLFFLSYYEAYLVDVNITPDDPDNQEEFSWDADAGFYRVRGTDQDGDPALATISPDETIGITKEEPGGGQADLRAAGLDLSLDIDRAAATVSWVLQATVVNSGSAASPECAIAYYLSADDQLDPGVDNLISASGADLTLPPLAAGEETTHSLTIDAVTDAGYNYILVKADAADAVSEESETNNAAAVKIRFARVVVESYYPSDFGPTIDTYLELYDKDGQLIAFNDNSFLFATIDYQAGLTVGLYYIRVNSKNLAIGPYAIRVVEDPGETRLYLDPPYTDDYEANDPATVPWANGEPVPVGITLGSANYVVRILENPSPGVGDLDWLELQLTPAD